MFLEIFAAPSLGEKDWTYTIIWQTLPLSLSETRLRSHSRSTEAFRAALRDPAEGSSPPRLNLSFSFLSGCSANVAKVFLVSKGKNALHGWLGRLSLSLCALLKGKSIFFSLNKGQTQNVYNATATVLHKRHDVLNQAEYVTSPCTMWCFYFLKQYIGFLKIVGTIALDSDDFFNYFFLISF